MNMLKELLKEYEDCRWYKHEGEQRFVFNTDKERFQFILRLNELNAEYFLYQDKSGYKVDVFMDEKAAGPTKNWLFNEVNDYAERLIAAGNLASFEAAFDSTDPDFNIKSLSLTELQEIYNGYIGQD